MTTQTLEQKMEKYYIEPTTLTPKQLKKYTIDKYHDIETDAKQDENMKLIVERLLELHHNLDYGYKLNGIVPLKLIVKTQTSGRKPNALCMFKLESRRDVNTGELLAEFIYHDEFLDLPDQQIVETIFIELTPVAMQQNYEYSGDKKDIATSANGVWRKTVKANLERKGLDLNTGELNIKVKETTEDNNNWHDVTLSQEFVDKLAQDITPLLDREAIHTVRLVPEKKASKSNTAKWSCALSTEDCASVMVAKKTELHATCDLCSTAYTRVETEQDEQAS